MISLNNNLNYLLSNRKDNIDMRLILDLDSSLDQPIVKQNNKSKLTQKEMD